MSTARALDAVEHGVREGETVLLVHGSSVAGWSWAPQVALLPHRHLLTPDLPGFGGRHREPWPGLDGATDDLAAIVAERAVGGHAHVVGLSLGGILGVRLAARHPGLVRTLLVSGAPLVGVGRGTAVAARVQVGLWDRRWYWRALATAMRLDADVRDRFVDDGLRLDSRTGGRVLEDVLVPSLPSSLPYRGRLVAVAGEREPRDARRAFEALRAIAPQLETWIAPGMHHQWSAEDPVRCSAMIEAVADGAPWPPTAATAG